MPEADPVFLITGASSGIGEATARAAAEHGHRVVLAARRQDQLFALAAELGGDERARAVRCDVTEWDDVQAAVAAATDGFGRLDVAFANASGALQAEDVARAALYAVSQPQHVDVADVMIRPVA